MDVVGSRTPYIQLLANRGLLGESPPSVQAKAFPTLDSCLWVPLWPDNSAEGSTYALWQLGASGEVWRGRRRIAVALIPWPR